MTVTIRDVAEAAGVSTATVSRALRGLPYVDEVTRAKVLDAAASLDYVVSPSASRLASGRTGTIAVVTPYIARWFFATLLAGVEQVTREANLDLLLLGVGDPDCLTEVPTEQRLRSRADGAIIMALPADNPDVRALLHANFPVSIVGSIVPDAPCIAIDDAEVARTATQHLLNLGHRSIGLISGTPGGSVYTAQHHRLCGYTEALAGAGVAIDEALVSFGGFTREGGERAMNEMLSRREVPTAVFAMSDEMAFGALLAMRKHGLRPGVDISVIGIDGHPQSEVLDLTTVEQSVEAMGRFAAESLLAGLGGGMAQTIGEPSGLIPTHLVVRGSTSSPREQR